ncbi:MAG: trypsin-like peptidase domain-containing protein, partial [Solirubrobacteraceae bacterium]|nr:trypsin-like peptidase domain-containing protein [Solirubrobacteraceae bacterium]
PAPPVAPPPARRGWVAPFLSALVGALAVVVVFLLVFGGDDAADPEPLPATAGPGGAQANARAIYARASGSVVSVVARTAGGRATGTGFLVGGRDTIVTNAHVVGTADRVQVRFGDDGRLLDAEVLGRDVSTDLAVVRVDPSLHTGNPLPLADSDDVRVGDAVVAIGNPFGLDRTATAGIVSATGRHISAPNGFDIPDVIQTDAPINPGNSGGPLLDARGRVIGVNSQIATSGAGGGNVGIGFAVPSNTVRDIVPQLEQGKRIRRAYLGVSTTTGPRGARVAEVTPSGPADTAGIRVGDDIIRVGGHAVGDSDDLGAVVLEFEPGDEVEVVVVRDGAERTITVRLGTRPGG